MKRRIPSSRTGESLEFLINTHCSFSHSFLIPSEKSNSFVKLIPEESVSLETTARSQDPLCYYNNNKKKGDVFSFH